MSGIPAAVDATVDLGPNRYQTSLDSLRQRLEITDPRLTYLRVALKTPKSETVELQIRHKDAYVVGFLGADGWYSFAGEAEDWGPSCGVGSNYSHLGKVGAITYDDLKNLGHLRRFTRGSHLDRRLVAILFAVTSEAVRFATVATYFVGMTNSVGTDHSAHLLVSSSSVDFEYLRSTYFQHWEKPPEVQMEPGKVYHRTGNDILLPHRK